MMRGRGGRKLSDVLFYVGYAFFTMLAYLPSLYARYSWSGTGFLKRKFFAMLIYNILCVYVHMKYVKYSCLPVVGEKEDPILGWISFSMIVVYMFSMPVTWSRRV
jgi:hypothetical protein